MNNANDNVKLLEQKANHFFRTGDEVHIKFKLKDGEMNRWKNGIILECSSDFFMLREFVDGEMPIFYLEIHDIVKFTRDGNG